MTERLTRSITTISTDPRLRLAGLTAYYVAILIAVMTLSTFSSFTTPGFVYQGF